jgi:hypothetical protein
MEFDSPHKDEDDYFANHYCVIKSIGKSLSDNYLNCNMLDGLIEYWDNGLDSGALKQSLIKL